jgi:alpha-ketoglutarate-dependent sulfate ester dioxygenase
VTKLSVAHEADRDLQIRPIGGRIGAEISGIRLSGNLASETAKEIWQALLRHRVIFFRNQGHLDEAGQEQFGRSFGELVPHPTVPSLAGTDYILDLDATKGGGRANEWHTDVTFDVAYPQASILRAVTVPARGGDTIWGNTVAAYEELRPELKALADQLWALHTNTYDYAAVHADARSEDQAHYDEIFTSTVYETEHPVVQIHPETGERALVLGNFVQKLIGYSKTDSAHLFNLFQSHITRPENTVRWRWQAGDVAIWDNRATQHYAVNDYGDQPRVVRRVTVTGDVPVSVDGRRSVARKRVQAAPAGRAAA